MSISGNGLNLIFRIAHPDMHLAQFDALVREIYEKTGLVADKDVAMSAACGELVTMPTHTSIRTRNLIGAC